MKNLVLIRHAKSDWGNPLTKDFDRSLNERGLRDAPFMASILKEKISSVDKIISSPAYRAMTTCKFFSSEYEFNEDKIYYDRGIYEDGQSTILSILKNLDNLDEEIKSPNTVFLFGHNPDITSTATYLSGERIDNIPTCGIVSIKFNINNWSEAIKVNGKREFFLYPKLYFKDSDFD